MADTSTEDLTTDHGVLITGKWDWTYNSTPGKQTVVQQGIKQRKYYIPTSATDPRSDGYGVLRSRLKIRGRGDALTIRFDSEEGKDFQILGWSIPHTIEVND